MLKRIAVAALIAVGLSGAASATTLTYLYTGVVDSSGDLSVPVGSPFTATLVIDLATPAGGIFPTFTRYDGAVVSASFSIGSGSGATGMNITIGDGPISDYFDVDFGTLAGSFGGFPIINAQINMADLDHTVFTSQALQVPTDLSQFEVSTFSIRFSGPTSPAFSGHLTSIQLVPEPSLAALLGAGVLALALRRRA